ncbi:sensor histidine kinase [Clavibacter zhangzhiyongii]|uniref:histidine kinase n=1 Tax=Clavibacter zhangzhiyongii TaxID=2768071 RepID=A0A7L7YZ04_9MICO|nr:histidine kinase [Clavibacter zhangzhiyongii]QOD42647.1 two-component sensor histidine kinase [Clavibacter zhangzhiyongii]
MRAALAHIIRKHPILVDVVIVAAATAFSTPFLLLGPDTPAVVAAAAAFLGLFLRRRLPWVCLVLAVPAFMTGIALVPVMVAQLQIGLVRRKRWHAYAASLAVGVAFGTVGGSVAPEAILELVLYASPFTVVPTMLGDILRERRIVVRQFDALQEAQALGQSQAAEMALARERAVLAREMHDVVSHQVSLIAVQAGALQVASEDPKAKDVARVIRGLSTVTLDELRSMVGVLRNAGGTDRPIAPQPTLDDLPALIASSGIDVTCSLDLPASLSPAVQRAIYRTVQEGLTNARKHSTGGAVTVTGWLEADVVVVDVHAGVATEPLLDLPSGGYGLTGMRERAQLLGGTLTSGTRPDGSHDLRLRLPV